MNNSSPDLVDRPILLFAQDWSADAPFGPGDDGIDLIDFDALDEPRPQPEPPAPEPPAITEQDLERARAEGYAAAETSAATRLAQARAQAEHSLATAIAGALAAADAAGRACRDRHAADLAASLVALLGATLPAIAAANAATTFTRVLAAIAPVLAHPDPITLSVHPDHAQTLARAIETLGDVKAGLRTIADPRVAPGDCRADWTDGGARYDAAACWRDLACALRGAGLALPTVENLTLLWPETNHAPSA